MTKHFVAMLLLASAPLSILACTQSQIESCLEGSMFDSENIEKLQQDGLDIAQTRERVEKACTDYQKIKTCLERLQSECDSATANSLETMTGVYDYMCGDGKQEMFRHLDCYIKPAVINAVPPCTTKFQNRMTSLGGRTDREAMTEMCQAVDGLKMCHSSAIKTECNIYAASFVEKLYDHAFKPVKRMLNCSGKNNSERRGAGAAVWLITAVAAVILSAAT